MGPFDGAAGASCDSLSLTKGVQCDFRPHWHRHSSPLESEIPMAALWLCKSGRCQVCFQRDHVYYLFTACWQFIQNLSTPILRISLKDLWRQGGNPGLFDGESSRVRGLKLLWHKPPLIDSSITPRRLVKAKARVLCKQMSQMPNNESQNFLAFWP